MSTYTYKVFRSANDMMKKESRHLRRSRTQPLAWSAAVREQVTRATHLGSLSWQQLLLLLVVESITTVLYGSFLSPPLSERDPDAPHE